jgi:hypothetical protein
MAAVAFATVFTLAACGEREQTAGAKPGVRKADTQAWEGAPGAQPINTAGSWKAGDKAAWEAQLKSRTERGQNEYTRVAPKPQ